jgi:ABC-type antimicrobial peptide transport system permease subunit
MTLHVRAAGDANGIAAQVKGEASIAQERLVARLSSFFGILALLLASMGLYGVLAYAAARRTGEIGIRMTLGAQPGDVAWMVMREVLLLTAVGLGIGLSIAAAATRLVASMPFGLTATIL